MALTITKLKMWKDPGYTRNCLEVPPAGSFKLPAVPDYSTAASETLRPHKGSTLTELHLPLSYSQVFSMSYLYIEATDGAGTVKLFGWITSIDQRSTSAEGVTIRWDVDWWRSFSGDVTWGSGIVKKCSDASYKRPYKVQPRFRKFSSSDIIKLSTPYNNGKHYYTVIITTVLTNNGVSHIQQFLYPLECGMVRVTDPNNLKTGFTIKATWMGFFDEALTAMGYDASIISVYVSPVGPESPTSGYDPNLGMRMVYPSDYVFTPTVSINTGLTTESVTFIMPTLSGTITSTHTFVLDNPLKSDYETIYTLVDMRGNKVADLPYGVEFKQAYVQLDIGTSGGYVVVNMVNEATGNVNRTSDPAVFRLNNPVGFKFSVPLPTIPVTENYWSSYNISGQRDFDVTSARIANDQKAASGIESTIQSGISGGVVGASAGPLGAVGGLLGGLLAGGITTGVNYALGENFNDQLQEARDQMYANQTNSIQLTGDSQEWWSEAATLGTFKGPAIIGLNADSVSSAEHAADVSLNGYDTDIPASSVSSFITAGGPLLIINLNLTGSVPPQAKQYIKDKLSSGVYITENNPSGVAP